VVKPSLPIKSDAMSARLLTWSKTSCKTSLQRSGRIQTMAKTLETIDRHTYVLVRHNQTGRSFTMDRKYAIIQQEIILPDVPEGYDPKETWPGWTPDHVFPSWAEILPKEEFTAYWYPEARPR
jgi:hypothetical protein